MKKVMIGMNLLMGLTMSFVLSLVGTAMGMKDKFNVTSWLMSFGISFVISLIIGFAVPVKKAGDAFCAKCNANPQSMKGNLLSSLISNVIYTPMITIIMVVVMLTNAAKHAAVGEVPPIPVVIIPSLIVSLLVGQVVIMISTPLYLKLLTKNMQKPE